VSEGIPKNEVTGFRHPFLVHSKASYDAVFASGAEYESSGTLDPNTNGYWPFTLDNGMPFSPQPCTIGCAEIASTSYPTMTRNRNLAGMEFLHSVTASRVACISVLFGMKLNAT
jgi:hypothetical protein